MDGEGTGGTPRGQAGGGGGPFARSEGDRRDTSLRAVVDSDRAVRRPRRRAARTDRSGRQRVLCLAGSANRDERVFPDGDRFDIQRYTGSLLTFGQGAHFCLGAALARLEGRVVLDEMLKRFTDWEVDYENCVLGTSPGVRGYEALPIILT